MRFPDVDQEVLIRLRLGMTLALTTLTFPVPYTFKCPPTCTTPPRERDITALVAMGWLVLFCIIFVRYSPVLPTDTSQTI